MRKLIIVAIVAALAALACVPAAMAAKTKTTVKMTSAFLGNGQSFWDGTIKSSKKACANKRSVTVYTGAGKKIGTVKSQRVTGVVGYHWTLAARIAVKPGKRYYAKVKATRSCGGAKSNIYTFKNEPQQLPAAPAPPSANGGS
jgi:hypothetical protein